MWRNTSGADNTVDGSAVRTRTRDETTSFNLGTPLLGREVHRVELGVDARVQQLFQTLQ